MPDFSFVLLYVDNPPASAAFYADLLGRPPLETSPTFAMLPLADKIMLGLWSKHTVEPAATPQGGHEVAFTVADADAVTATFADWKRRDCKSHKRRPRWISATPLSRLIRTVTDFGCSRRHRRDACVPCRKPCD